MVKETAAVACAGAHLGFENDSGAVALLLLGAQLALPYLSPSLHDRFLRCSTFLYRLPLTPQLLLESHLFHGEL